MGLGEVGLRWDLVFGGEASGCWVEDWVVKGAGRVGGSVGRVGWCVGELRWYLGA